MTTHFMIVEGKRLAYTDEGQGQAVLLVPGLGDLKESYRFLVPELLAAGFRVICLDVRGHGESDAGWHDYSVGAVGADIVALLRHLGLKAVHYVGNSMAAGAGVWAAVEDPGLLASAVMIGPFYQGETPLAMKLILGPLFWWPWGIAFWIAFYSGLFPSKKPADFSVFTARMRTLMRQPGRLKATTSMMFASKKSSGERLDRYHVPTLVLMGSRDPDFKNPAADAKAIATDLKGDFIVVEGAGHYPQAEFPAESLAALLNFWKTVKS